MAKPYAEREKELLTSLVVQETHIIENKKTDGATLQMKQAWIRIADNYNMQLDITMKRNNKQLKKLWDNLKQRKRKITTEERYSQLLTGGGPGKKICTDPVLDLINVAAPHLDTTLNCPWDSTAIYENAHTKVTEVEYMDTALNSPLESTAGFENTEPKSADVDHSSVQNTCPGTSGYATEKAVTPTTSKRRTLNYSRFNERKNKDEVYWRVLKIKEGIEQQRELHKKRIEAAKYEAELTRLKLEEYKKK